MVGGASRASGPTPAAKLNPYPRSRRTLSAFARARLLHYHHVHPAPARHHYPILAARLGGARETLLVDLYATFEAAGWPEAIPSVTIVERLIAMESRPWPERKRGKPITVRQLASLLRPFDVHPRNHCGAGGQAKAYFLDALRPVFDAYLPNEGGLDPSHRPNALTQGISVNSLPSRPETAGRIGNHGNSYKRRDWDGGTDGNPASPGNGTGGVPLSLQPPGTITAGEAYRRVRDGE